MRNIASKIVAGALVTITTLSGSLTAFAGFAENMQEYRKSVSQTIADEVSDKIPRRHVDVGLTPITGANPDIGSSTDNNFRSSNGSRKVYSSSVGFGGATILSGSGSGLTGMRMLGYSWGGMTNTGKNGMSSIYMVPYNPLPILPNSDYTTANKTPTLVGFYKTPTQMRGGVIQFKITDSASPASETTVYQSGSSNYVLNASYGAYTSYTLSPGVYYWHLRSVESLKISSSWVYGGKLTIMSSANLYTVNPYTSPVGTKSTSITGTRSTSTVTITPTVASGSVVVSYPTSTTFQLDFSNLNEGGNVFSFDAYDTQSKATDSYTNIIVVDTIAPSPVAVSIVPNSVINNTKYISTQTGTVNFTATDPNGVQYRTSLDGTNWSSWASFVSSAVIDFGSDNGMKTLRVQYKDSVGNTSSNVIDSAIFDNSIAAPVISSPNNGQSYATGDSYVTIIGTTDSDTSTLTVNGLPIAYAKGSGMFSVRVSLAQGANTFVLQATDNAGNISPTKAMTITYDPSLSSLNRGSDQTLYLGSVEAQSVELQRISENPNAPSEVFQTDNTNIDSSSLPRFNTNQ